MNRRAFWRCGIDLGKFVRGKDHINSRGIFFEIFDSFRARYWDNIAALRQYPRQGHLAGFDSFSACYSFDFPDQTKVLFEVLALKARVMTSEVTFRDVLNRFK